MTDDRQEEVEARIEALEAKAAKAIEELQKLRREEEKRIAESN